MSTDVILRTIGLKKYFGAVHAVEGVDLAVMEGEVFGFLGPNGAGKTTTIGMVLGLLHPTAGRVQLFGEEVTPSRTKALRRVGALVGGPALVPYLPGRDNLLLAARLHENVGRQRVEAVLEQVGLAGAAGRKVEDYSLGMKQRLGLATALLHRPELLILDEPTNGLDPAGMRDIRELLRTLAANGVTVLLSSHLLHEVEQVCDRVAVINRGRIVADGPMAALLGGKPIVRARVANPAQAADILRVLPGVERIEANGCYVEVSGPSSEQVIGSLAAAGIYPSEVTSRGSDLESIFLALTREAA